MRSELFDADRHRLMAVDGLRAVGAKQAVPPGKVKTEIAVCFVSVNEKLLV